VQVRLHGAAVADGQALLVRPDGRDLDPQLVTDDRGYVKTADPFVGVDIAAADPDATDADQGFTGAGDPGSGRSVRRKSPGFSSTMVFMADSILERQQLSLVRRFRRLHRF